MGERARAVVEVRRHLMSALELLTEGPESADDWSYITLDLERALGVARWAENDAARAEEGE